MAHNINKMAYVGEKPWHSLGTSLGDRDVDSVTMVKAAGLDFNVEMVPVAAQVNGTAIEIPDKRAAVRTDTGVVFNVMSDRWEPVQNIDAFQFFDTVVGDGAAIYHTAGALGRGEKVWILARLPETSIVAGDEIERYILLANGHDGGSAFTFQMTPIRVVCQNTLNIALGSIETSRVYRKFHLSGVTARLNPEDARGIIGLADTFYAEFEAKANGLAARKMTAKALDEFVTLMLPAPKPVLALPAPQAANYTTPTLTINRRRELTDLIVAGKGNDRKGVKGTAWAAFNGVAEWTDYIQGRDDGRAKSLLMGTGRAMKQRAWDILTATK